MEYKVSDEDVRNIILERSEADAGFNLFVYVYYNLNTEELFASCYDNMADGDKDLVFLGDVTEWERPNAAVFCLEESSVPENVVADWREYIENRIKTCRIDFLNNKIFIEYYPMFKKLAEN